MRWIYWLRASSFRIFTLAFFLMVIPPVLLVPAAQAGSIELTWLLIGVIACANLIVLWMDRK